MYSKVSSHLLVVLGLLVLFFSPVFAQSDKEPEPGSPDYTTSIDGKQLPPPDPAFGGVIKEKATDSKPWWPPRIVPPKGAPNVLLIMTDDAVSARRARLVASSRHLRWIASRKTDCGTLVSFHVTLFADARGADHRPQPSCGRLWRRGRSGDWLSQVTIRSFRKDCGTIGEILKENGYATSWFGKDHNTPFYQASQAGPFDQWPIGMGFDYFYGFVGGDTSQWQPNLFRNTTAIYPFQGNPGWNLTTAMADDAIAVHEATQRNRARPTVLRLLRSRRHPRAASSDAGVDQENQRHAFVR